MRIFLVENHPDTLTYLRRFLQRAGHEVETAQTVAEALRELPAKSPDVLLADLGLPDGDGWSLLEQLGSARPPLAIAMSGHGSAADCARSSAAGLRTSHHFFSRMTSSACARLRRQARIAGRRRREKVETPDDRVSAAADANLKGSPSP